MAVPAEPELDEVVELAVVLPDFDRDLDAPDAEAITTGHAVVRSVATRSTLIVLMGLGAVVAGAVGTDRGTLPGPESTVTTEVVVGSTLEVDPLYGVIPEGRVVVGQDIASGSYIAIPHARSTGCSWTLDERAADARYQSRRSQTQVTLVTIDVQPGQVLVSHGCHWRWR